MSFASLESRLKDLERRCGIFPYPSVDEMREMAALRIRAAFTQEQPSA